MAETCPTGALARRKPQFRPSWGPASVYYKFARNYVSANLWRVSRYCPGLDDAMQEAALVFTRCLDRYITNPVPHPDYRPVDNPAWFMALYRNALVNHWAGLALKTSRATALEQPDEDEADAPAEPSLWQALASVSDELKAVYAILLEAPEETLQVIWHELRDPEQRWHLNTRLRRMARLAPGVDLVRELRDMI